MNYLINNVVTDWNKLISIEFSKSYLVEIDKKLFETNQHILPNRVDIFRAFNFFNVKDTKLVIFGQDPYQTPDVADGLAFSSKQKNIPPSLRNLFKKLEIDLKIKRTNPNLVDWASQGILLLNTSLTVTANIANSHKDLGWIHFIKACISHINENTNHVTFLLLGENAKKLEQYIDNKKHFIVKRAHPSPLARNKIFEQDLFAELNNLILDNKFHHMKW